MGAPRREIALSYRLSRLTLQSAQCTEVYFASFLLDGFTTMAVLFERKLTKRNSVQCTELQSAFGHFLWFRWYVIESRDRICSLKTAFILTTTDTDD